MIIEKQAWPQYFEEILQGNKTYDLRLNDFECKVGDTLLLKEWDPTTQKYTGREIKKEITYIGETNKFRFWSKADADNYGYKIMSLENSNQEPKKISDSEEQIGVCVIVLDKEHKNILLGKRLGSYRAGTYGCPGGRLQRSETLIDCSKRELVEETSLVANALHYVGVIREYQEDHNYNFIHFVYYCEDFSGEPKTMEPTKCEGWQWYPLDTLPENLIKGHHWALDMFKNKEESKLHDTTLDTL